MPLKNKERNRMFILNYKKEKHCNICGYNKHTEILCFHHIDPKNKTSDMDRLKRNGTSIKKIKEEMDKCILLCPNCHMWFHYASYRVK